MGHWLRAMLAGAAGLLLSACSTLATLPDGRPTTLDELSIAARAGLTISTERLNATPRYTPVEGCSYSSVNYYATSPEHWRWNVRPVRDRLLVSMERSEGEVSTALIGPDGELFDFNLINARTGGRSTEESFGQEARQIAAGLNQLGGHAINDLEVYLPHWRVAAAGYGDVVAQVRDETGGLWARYLYAGTTTYQARPAVILDLVRNFETQPGAGLVVIGYSLVDRETALPLLTVMHMGYRYRLEQLSCG